MRLLGTCKLPRGQRVRQWREGNRIILEPLVEHWPEMSRNVAGIWPAEIPRPGDR